MNWDSFYPPMVGSFLGVGLGILANHYYQEYIADKNKEKYRRMIKSEIEQCIKRLEDDLVKFLPSDRWTSAVNSGALKLFDVEKESGPLSVLYQRIKDYNYTITTGQFDDISWIILDRLRENDKLGSEKSVKHARLLRSKILLLKQLRDLNNAEWLNPSNEPVPGYNDANRYEVNERH